MWIYTSTNPHTDLKVVGFVADHKYLCSLNVFNIYKDVAVLFLLFPMIKLIQNVQGITKLIPCACQYVWQSQVIKQFDSGVAKILDVIRILSPSSFQYMSIL
jgi:hypothetical protein